jgi:hypothetical protein
VKARSFIPRYRQPANQPHDIIEGILEVPFPNEERKCNWQSESV